MTHDGSPGVRGCGMKKLNFCIAKKLTVLLKH
jgi:hypothetical protein